jgi:prevent-host-death family protein
VNGTVAAIRGIKVGTKGATVNSIGIRELRNGLSRHLAAVRAGQTLTITDHGRPVARIVPVDQPNPLERLIAEGRVQPAKRTKEPSPDPIRVNGTVSDLIA